MLDELLTKSSIGFMNYQKKGDQPSCITAEDSSSMSHGTRKSSRFQQLFDKLDHSKGGGSNEKAKNSQHLYNCSEDEDLSIGDSASSQNKQGEIPESGDEEEDNETIEEDLKALQIGINYAKVNNNEIWTKTYHNNNIYQAKWALKSAGLSSYLAGSSIEFNRCLQSFMAVSKGTFWAHRVSFNLSL